MPRVGDQHFPYTPAGYAAAARAKKSRGYSNGGRVGMSNPFVQIPPFTGRFDPPSRKIRTDDEVYYENPPPGYTAPQSPRIPSNWDKLFKTAKPTPPPGQNPPPSKSYDPFGQQYVDDPELNSLYNQLQMTIAAGGGAIPQTPEQGAASAEEARQLEQQIIAAGGKPYQYFTRLPHGAFTEGRGPRPGYDPMTGTYPENSTPPAIPNNLPRPELLDLFGNKSDQTPSPRPPSTRPPSTRPSSTPTRDQLERMMRNIPTSPLGPRLPREDEVLRYTQPMPPGWQPPVYDLTPQLPISKQAGFQEWLNSGSGQFLDWKKNQPQYAPPPPKPLPPVYDTTPEAPEPLGGYGMPPITVANEDDVLPEFRPREIPPEYDKPQIPIPYEPEVTYSCFVAGTPIDMADGSSKNIEDIIVDDEVKTRWSLDTVTFVHDIPEALRTLVTINDRITCTDSHPFLTEDGWKSCNPEASKPTYEEYDIEIGQLTVGDNLVTVNGPEEVTELISREELAKVYNFTTDKTHTYLVDGVVAHNKSYARPLPDGFVRPTVITKDQYDEQPYYNPETGESFWAPSGGYNTPPGWVRGTKQDYEASSGGGTDPFGGKGLFGDRWNVSDTGVSVDTTGVYDAPSTTYDRYDPATDTYYGYTRNFAWGDGSKQPISMKGSEASQGFKDAWGTYGGAQPGGSDGRDMSPKRPGEDWFAYHERVGTTQEQGDAARAAAAADNFPTPDADGRYTFNHPTYGPITGLTRSGYQQMVAEVAGDQAQSRAAAPDPAAGRDMSPKRPGEDWFAYHERVGTTQEQGDAAREAARVDNANWLLKMGHAPDFDTAYAMATSDTGQAQPTRPQAAPPPPPSIAPPPPPPLPISQNLMRGQMYANQPSAVADMTTMQNPYVFGGYGAPPSMPYAGMATPQIPSIMGMSPQAYYGGSAQPVGMADPTQRVSYRSPGLLDSRYRDPGEKDYLTQLWS